MSKRSSLRKGYTTGTCAAAATKAAAIAVRNQASGVRTQESKDEVEVSLMLPDGHKAVLQAKILEVCDDYAFASVVKDAGDDPDVTDGAEIIATVKIIKSDVRSEVKGVRDTIETVLIKGGKGVGVITKPGLQIPVGEPAINPVPRMMIKNVIREVLRDTKVEVTIEVPKGEELSKKTFNPRLGIVGGISIIGTTGIVEPMSLDALKATVRCEIDVAVAESRVKNNSTLKTQNSKLLYFAPGKIGEDALKRLSADVRVVQMSNFIGEALDYAKKKGVERVVIGGHPGKLAKVLMGYYDTHSKNSPQATDFVAEYMGLNKRFNTVEEIIIHLRSEDTLNAEGFSELAENIARKIKEDFGFKGVEIYLFDMKKNLIGEGIWDG